MLKLNKILIIRTDRIGDVILTTPVITVLRQYYPDAKLYFLTREYTAPLLKHHLDLDKVVIYDPENRHQGLRGHLQLGRELKCLNFDAAFLFHPRPGLALALKVADIPERIGTGYRWYSLFLNHRIYEHRKHGIRHELEYNLALLQKYISAIPTADQITFRFSMDNLLKAKRKNALAALGIKREYIILHPGSGGSAPRLPIEMFEKILSYLGKQSQNQILLVGSAGEEKLLHRLKNSGAPNPALKIAISWNLETYLAVIGGCKLFIANSTGPLHMARSLGVPLLSFYCPAIPCSPRRWGPYNQPDAVLTPAVEPCKTGNPRKCPHGNCLSKIEWDSIRKRLDELLSIAG